MKKLYQFIRDYALKAKNSDGFFGTTVKFLFHLFSNDYVRGFVTIIGTVGIGLMTGLQYFGFWLYFSIGLYSVSILFMSWADSYLREQLVQTREMTQALRGINVILRKWAIALQELTKKIARLPAKNRKQLLNNAISDCNIQQAAIDVCQNLQQHLTKYYNNDHIYITVFQKQIGDDGTTCRMIAHSENYTPNSYDTVYKIPSKGDAKIGKIEYHSYIFSENITEIMVLSDSKQVKDSFIIHTNSEEREKEIQQYIAVPISIAKIGVTLLLQIDTNQKGLFGGNEVEVKNFAKLAIYPYAQFLHLIYGENRVINELVKEK